jgi:hypothetical protein
MKINRLLVYLLMAAALALPLLAGCINQPPIERAVICAAVSKTGEPLLAADNFTPDINTIYCSVKLNAPSAKSMVRADWYLVKSDEAELTDFFIGTGTVAAETPFVVCSFARSEMLLPRGDYQVKLYFDNKFAQSVPFQVQGEAAPSAAILSEAVLCSSINPLTEKPIGNVNIFPSDVSSIYCSVKVSGAAFSDQIKARWVYMGGELEGVKGKTVAEAVTKVEGREYVSLSMGRAEGKNFPTGDYNVNVYVGDKGQVSLDFKVVDPAAVPALYIGEAGTFAYTDSEKKAANLTARFPIDAADIIFKVKIYNAPPVTPMSIQWIIVLSDEAGLDNEMIKEDKYTVSGTDEPVVILTRGKDNFPKGDYTVRLLLNGEEKVALPFKVQ